MIKFDQLMAGKCAVLAVAAGDMRRFLIGIDEVGRGPLAGPVTVCAVSVSPDIPRSFFTSIRNSKALTAPMRDMWYLKVRAARKAGLLDYRISSASARFIDRHGIVRALRAALSRSISRLELDPRVCRVFLDGSLYAPERYVYQRTIIKGDEKVPVIALASIIAKVHRDRLMTRLSKTYLEYGFEQHVGYGTKAHLKAISKYGPSKIHRLSFLRNVVY